PLSPAQSLRRCGAYNDPQARNLLLLLLSALVPEHAGRVSTALAGPRWIDGRPTSKGGARRSTFAITARAQLGVRERPQGRPLHPEFAVSWRGNEAPSSGEGRRRDGRTGSLQTGLLHAAGRVCGDPRTAAAVPEAWSDSGQQPPRSGPSEPPGQAGRQGRGAGTQEAAGSAVSARAGRAALRRFPAPSPVLWQPLQRSAAQPPPRCRRRQGERPGLPRLASQRVGTSPHAPRDTHDARSNPRTLRGRAVRACVQQQPGSSDGKRSPALKTPRPLSGGREPASAGKGRYGARDVNLRATSSSRQAARRGVAWREQYSSSSSSSCRAKMAAPGGEEAEGVACRGSRVCRQPLTPSLSPRKRTTSQSKTEPPLLRTSKRTIYTAGRPPWYNETGTPFKEAFVIGLCGGSASGKTTVANKIIEALDVPWVVLLSMDSFYKVLNKEQQQAAARNEYNFDHPDAFDFDLLASVLRKLKEGKSVKVPVYDFTTHSRRKEWVCECNFGNQKLCSSYQVRALLRANNLVHEEETVDVPVVFCLW
uniref:Phosphoribulokinase/uridine kinase domain-containing protein n=1 Tax=Salvator merianae TaxID=96440 RepID=A0A8D0C467_SALMN